MKVMIVDGNHSDRDMLSHIIEGFFQDVEVVVAAKEWDEENLQISPDLLFIDLSVLLIQPEFILKKVEKQKMHIVLMVTSNKNYELFKPYTRCLLKPILISELQAEIEHVIEHIKTGHVLKNINGLLTFIRSLKGVLN